MSLTKRFLSRAAGLALVLTGVAVIAAAPASANDRSVSVLCTDHTTGTWEVSVTFSSIEVKPDRSVTVMLGSQTATLTTVGPNGTVTLKQDFDAGQTSADLTWTIVRIDYQNIGKLHLVQPAGCLETTTTAPPSSGAPTTTVPAPPTKSIAVQAGSLCRNDTPYVAYHVTPVGFVPQNNVTIRWKTTSGRVVQVLMNQPFTGTLVWPGVVLSGGQPVHWPGWELKADGTYVQVATDLRPTMIVEFSVNPTSSAQVTYPSATPTCHPSPTNNHQVKAAHLEASLPVTGGPSVLLVALGFATVLGGLTLVLTSRRRPSKI
jgi:hypothetical protein